MPRIPDEVIEQIKSKVSLLELAKCQGYELVEQGDDFILSCPFHEDKTPSCRITPTKNIFHCFGCGAKGDVIEWLVKTENLKFRAAVEKLLADNPFLVAHSSAVETFNTINDWQFTVGQSNDELMIQVIEFYHQTLLDSPEALAYLEYRGLKNDDLIREFKLGYANRTLGYNLPQKRTKAGDALRGQLTEIGLYRKTGHEHFNGSLVVPVMAMDNGDHIVEAYGRKINNNLREGTPKHLYLPGGHAGVWNAAGLQGCTEVILCEALIDAMTFWVHGFRNVTASYGTNGFTDDHLQVFKQLGIEKVLIAYDRDESGNNAAEALAKKLSKENIACYRVNLPKGMDVNEFSLQVKPAKKSLGVAIQSAAPLFDPEKLNQCDQADVEALQKKPQTLPSFTAPVHPAPAALVHPGTSVANPVTEKSGPILAGQEGLQEFKINYGNRHYRVRGLQKNQSYDVLKINLLIEVNGVVSVDTFDLYSAKHRQQFIRSAASECSVEEKVIRQDLGKLLLQLESVQDQVIQEALKPKESKRYKMEASEKEQALALLKDKHLAQRIVNDFAVTGLVGEPTNALMGYLAVVSRKLKNPLAIIVQSTSAAGKSALMDAVLDLVPDDDKVNYSAMTGQSLFYLGKTSLKHKILAIAEEEGVRQAAYALKILQSQGELTIASTGKDPQSGKLVTEEYRVEGPVMLFLTTTAIDIDEELLNRCVVLTINESSEQSKAIQDRQRQAKTLEGLLANNQSERIVQQHQNAQRLLRSLPVVNPYAEQLTFSSARTRTRRDHQKYLTLIDAIALLHQYQRTIKTVEANGETIEYIEATIDDIALANDLAHEILGRSLDELPPPTRKLLQQLYSLVANKTQEESMRQCDVRFTRRELREAAGLSDKQVRVHLERLVELEYVFAHSGKNGQRFIYELAFDGDVNDHHPQLMGLIDIEQLKKTGTTTNLVAKNINLVPSSWSASGPVVASSCQPKNSIEPSNDKGLKGSEKSKNEITLISDKKLEHRNRSCESVNV